MPEESALDKEAYDKGRKHFADGGMLKDAYELSISFWLGWWDAMADEVRFLRSQLLGKQ